MAPFLLQNAIFSTTKWSALVYEHPLKNGALGLVYRLSGIAAETDRLGAALDSDDFLLLFH